MKKYELVITRHLNGKKIQLESLLLDSDKSVSEILCNEGLELCKKYGIDNTKANLYELENGLKFWCGVI